MQDPESGGQRYVQCVPEPVNVPNNVQWVFTVSVACSVVIKFCSKTSDLYLSKHIIWAALYFSLLSFIWSGEVYLPLLNLPVFGCNLIIKHLALVHFMNSAYFPFTFTAVYLTAILSLSRGTSSTPFTTTAPCQASRQILQAPPLSQTIHCSRNWCTSTIKSTRVMQAA